MNNVKEVQVRD